MSAHQAYPARPVSWGRSLGVSALAFVLVAVAGAALWIVGRPSPAFTTAPGSMALSAFDYGFSPDRMTWRAGERITLTFSNDNSPPLSASISDPEASWGVIGEFLRGVSPAIKGALGKPHELMMGRGGPVAEQTVFGPHVVGGFETDFFEGVEVELLDAEGVSMLMPGDAFVSGLEQLDMSGMDMGQMGEHGGAPQLMLLLEPGGRATIRFTVPNKPGRWEFGCFQQSGQHYANGMRGIVTVART